MFQVTTNEDDICLPMVTWRGMNLSLSLQELLCCINMANFMAEKKKLQNIACKYRIYPTEAQKKFIAQNVGHNRWWWNYCVRTTQDHYWQHKDDTDDESKYINAQFDISRRLPQMKKDDETKWLKDAAAISLIHTSQAVDKAYAMFKKRRNEGLSVKKAGLPHKHKKTRKGGFTIDFHPTHPELTVDWEHGMIYMMKKKGMEPWVKAVLHRHIDGTPKHVTFSRGCDGRYYASVCFELKKQPKQPKKPTLKGTLGIDLAFSVKKKNKGHGMGVGYGSDDNIWLGVDYPKKAAQRLKRLE